MFFISKIEVIMYQSFEFVFIVFKIAKKYNLETFRALSTQVLLVGLAWEVLLVRPVFYKLKLQLCKGGS